MTHSTIHFPLHTIASAPPSSQPAMERLRQSVGMIPNLAAAMAESPVLIEAFESVRAIIHSKGAFTQQEGEAISLVNAVENGCDYCTAIHATFGLAAGLDAATIDTIRAKKSPVDRKLALLVGFARKVVVDRGHIQDADLRAFLESGFTQAQALEVVARLAMSVMANYSGHLAKPSPDDAIKPQYRRS
jgi:AhpD family alkylhydroperoxidase